MSKYVVVKTTTSFLWRSIYFSTLEEATTEFNRLLRFGKNAKYLLFKITFSDDNVTSKEVIREQFV